MSKEPLLGNKPSSWVVKHLSLIPKDGQILDLACGHGRHSLYAAQEGYRVDAIDRDSSALFDLNCMANITTYLADLEVAQWQPQNRSYDGIIVTRYLYRPLLQTLFEILKPGGVLIYETFMLGNERFGKPSNPNFLLQPNELLDFYGPLLSIFAFEQGVVETPVPACMQRICAIKT
jgi:SAM-dependent methyltransferase